MELDSQYDTVIANGLLSSSRIERKIEQFNGYVVYFGKDRFLFTYWTGNTFIILNHFVKQTQKTPKSEIDKAKRLLEEYKKRGD